MNGKRSRRPTRRCGMTACAIRGNAQSDVIRIYTTIKIRRVTGRTLRRRTRITARMTVQTIRRKVRPGERESGGIVVKNIIRIARRMAGETGSAVVIIPWHPVVLIVRFRVSMAGGAGKFRVIRWVRVAIHAGIPLAIVLSTVNRKILYIVVKSGGYPRSFRVATGTVLRKLERRMAGAGRRSIIRRVTAVASVRCVVVSSVVTGCAIIRNGSVCAV